MEMVSKISKGSKMDQIYIPKNRAGLSVGSFVLIRSLEEKGEVRNPYLYGVEHIEPIKLRIIDEIFLLIEKTVDYENMIVTGSFLDEGFGFNDVDVIVLTDNEVKVDFLKKKIIEEFGVKVHFIVLSGKEFVKGLETDPLYSVMISKCVSRKRFLYNVKRRINYKILDLHLLKSKNLIEGFDVLDGNEKYDLVRNLAAIDLFLGGKKIGKGEVDREIKKIFGLKDVSEIKLNMLDKMRFLRNYKKVYQNVFGKILKGIKNGSK